MRESGLILKASVETAPGTSMVENWPSLSRKPWDSILGLPAAFAAFRATARSGRQLTDPPSSWNGCGPADEAFDYRKQKDQGETCDE